MPFTQIKISQFRNLGSVTIAPSPSLNFLFGENGSGKTSVLEAISVLAHGRSFRTRKYRRLIQYEQPEFVVFGKSAREKGGETGIGVSRHRNGESKFRLGGQSVASAAELANELPLLVLNAESFGLLAGAPKQRRQFFDWLVFHVKHEFAELWRQYARCVKQRNTLLRRDKISRLDVAPWDAEMLRLAVGIEACRSACVAPFLDAFRVLADELELGGPQVDVAVEYLSGWRGDAPYEEQLTDAFDRDRKLGYTTLGPHKSDIKITIRKTNAGEILSRGQQKSMIAALHVAQARVFAAKRQRQCVFLIDDMPAELDAANMARVGRWINHTAAQVFVTGVEFLPMRTAWPDIAERSPKVFHVEHGEVTEVVFNSVGGGAALG